MIILDLLDVLDNLADDQRELALSALINELTQFSHYAILEAQLEWDGNRPYEEFISYQNEVIVDCVKAEMSHLGVVLRRMHGLDPLTLRTELEL